MAFWPKGITLFETCFVPAGLQGDIAHASKRRRDSEYKSGILYSVVVVTPAMTQRHGSTLHSEFGSSNVSVAMGNGHDGGSCREPPSAVALTIGDIKGQSVPCRLRD